MVEVLIRDYYMQKGIAISGKDNWKTKTRTDHQEN